MRFHFQIYSLWLPRVLSQQTSVTEMLNGFIAQSTGDVYTGGKGVFVRNPFDDLETGDRRVVPTTFWSNDMAAPSQLYPGSGGGYGNPWCPNDGTDGVYSLSWSCDSDVDQDTGFNHPWNNAQMAYVVGSSLDSIMPDWNDVQSADWGWGVYYATDSNSVDKRCRWLGSDNLYDCPGGTIPNGGWFQPDSNRGGTGYYEAGNPYAGLGGGGTGCHFDDSWEQIDQPDAYDNWGTNIVQDWDCQCNYGLGGNNWQDWVSHWLQHATPKPDFWQEDWFGNKKAPSWALDNVACWVNNLRDMIKLSNAIYWARDDWSNQKIPMSSWNSDPASLRYYWGWNEIPFAKDDMTNSQNWDSVVIKLPAAICGNGGGDDSVNCLDGGAQKRLASDIWDWINAGYVVPGEANVGNRPGSYVVFVREWADNNFNWQKYFFCEGFSQGGITIVSDGSLCYIQQSAFIEEEQV